MVLDFLAQASSPQPQRLCQAAPPNGLCFAGVFLVFFAGWSKGKPAGFVGTRALTVLACPSSELGFFLSVMSFCNKSKGFSLNGVFC